MHGTNQHRYGQGHARPGPDRLGPVGPIRRLLPGLCPVARAIGQGRTALPARLGRSIFATPLMGSTLERCPDSYLRFESGSFLHDLPK